MKKPVASLLFAMLAVACTTEQVRQLGPNALTAEDKQNEQLAIQNIMCVFENQDRCSHVIENRGLMTRFFAPETQGGMEEEDKNRGRRITTKFIVEAAATIKQCRRVTEESLVVLRDIKIAGGTYLLKATKPADTSSACFLTPAPEAQ